MFTITLLFYAVKSFMTTKNVSTAISKTLPQNVKHDKVVHPPTLSVAFCCNHLKNQIRIFKILPRSQITCEIWRSGVLFILRFALGASIGREDNSKYFPQNEKSLIKFISRRVMFGSLLN